MGQTLGGVPISHNVLQHYPECHGADTGGTRLGPARRGVSLPGGVPCQGDTLLGGTLPGVGYPPWPGWGAPS